MHITNDCILGSLREKFEYIHADEAALSALFEEFGPSKFSYFEGSGRSSGSWRLEASLATVLLALAGLLV